MTSSDGSPPSGETDAQVRALLRQMLGSRPTASSQTSTISSPAAPTKKKHEPTSLGARAPDQRPRVHRPTWLTEDQLRHAEASLWLAEQHGITSIPDALRWFVEHHGVAAKAPLIRDAIEEFFRIKEGEGCGFRTMQAYHTNLRRFAEVFGERVPVDVSPADVSKYFEKWSNPATRRSVWSMLVSFYAWCWRRKYVPTNPVLILGKFPRTMPAPRYVLTPAEAGEILRRTHETDEIAYWALGMFAGLRSMELQRLQDHPAPWSIIKLDAGVIDLPAEVSKTRGRIVPILPVLRSWLHLLRRRNVPFFPRNHIPKAARLRAAVLGDRCKSGTPDSEEELLRSANIARRSFISYRLAMVGASYAQVANEVGNSEEVVRSYYQNVVGRTDAREYFSLTPKVVTQSGVKTPRTTDH